MKKILRKSLHSLVLEIDQAWDDIQDIQEHIQGIQARLDRQQKLANAHAISECQKALDAPNKEGQPLFTNPQIVLDQISPNKDPVFDYKDLMVHDIVEHTMGSSGPYRTVVRTVPTEFHGGAWVITKVWRYNTVTEEYSLLWTK